MYTYLNLVLLLFKIFMMKKITLFLTLSFIISLSFSQNKIEIKNWLKSGSVKVSKPAFSDTEDVNGKTFKHADVLKKFQIDLSTLSPKTGETIKLGSSQSNWEIITVKNDSLISTNIKKGSIILLAGYISVDRWTDLKIKLSTNALYELYIDNELKKTKKNIPVFDSCS